jgi:hypothetical protein
MRIDVRPVSRLRGADPPDIPAALGPVLDALRGTDIDLSRVSVVCDWIQYRSNFREVADYRPVLAAPRADQDEVGGDLAAADHVAQGGSLAQGGGVIPGSQPAAAGCLAPGGAEQAAGPPPEVAVEIALDLRRCGKTDLTAVVMEILREHAEPARSARVPVEPWVAGRRSCIWRFNALYWQALSHWEQATGSEYEQALPGGVSEARNVTAVRELILELFKAWDDLDARGALPGELYVVELGVGNGNQARTWLDEFAALSAGHSRDYYRRLHYLMGDNSPHVLGRALKAVAQHGDHVNALVVDATHPAVSLGFLRGKAFLVYISNVYDNLPGDEVARIGGRPYLVEVRGYLPAGDADRIAREFSAPADRVPDLVGKLLRLGPELLCEAMPQQFGDLPRAVAFWREAWAALRLQERYLPLDGLDGYQIAPDLPGELLRSSLEAGGDLRMHVNNGALSSFAETLPLLHPFGRLQCHDLFVSDIRQYRTGFYGPGKYDGSVVNWVNGPLLRHIGGRAGFDVRISPFAARPAANVTTLTAQVRD